MTRALMHSGLMPFPGQDPQRSTCFCTDGLLEVLDNFAPIGLNDMGRVSLMRRIDSKYWFNVKQLAGILQEITGFYDILQINGDPIQAYSTRYFDTPFDSFYLDHQNGRGNRLKIRKREYIGSDLRFLEVKRKNQKGATSKRRIPVEFIRSGFDSEEMNFLSKELTETPSDLFETIRNQFNRVTLVNRNFKERCTIDFNISFFRGHRTTTLCHIAIIELKQMGRNIFSPLNSALLQRHIHASGFSKYCIGRALLQPELKQNRFKPTLLKLKKHQYN